LTLLGPKKRGKDSSSFRQISLLAAVPALLIAAPLVGIFGGQWLDEKFGTDPYLTIAGVILGFAAAGMEIYGLVKKSAAMENDDNEE